MSVACDSCLEKRAEVVMMMQVTVVVVIVVSVSSVLQLLMLLLLDHEQIERMRHARETNSTR
jgi:hypothetical protein